MNLSSGVKRFTCRSWSSKSARDVWTNPHANRAKSTDEVCYGFATAQTRLLSSQITIYHSIPPLVLQINASREILHQILSNASKYQPPNFTDFVILLSPFSISYIGVGRPIPTSREQKWICSLLGKAYRILALGETDFSLIPGWISTK